jgi:amidase
MKPTHGLVPYTGIVGVDPVIDHCGPITNTVLDNALLLEVLAGPDGIDPRQANCRGADYTRALNGDIRKLKIGLVTEGFDQPGADPEIRRVVRAAAAKFSDLGALVTEVSIPGHAFAQAVFAPLAFEGAVAVMMEGSGYPPGIGGLYIPSLFKAQAAWRDRADEMPDTAKLGLLAGAYFRKHHGGRFYGKARNLRATVIASYESALEDIDLLLMPTVPVKTAALPSPDSPRDYALLRSFEVLANTAQFDATGHPAMSIPCGMIDGLPVGMMLVGKYVDEATIYRCAHAFEQAVNWQSL